MEEWVYRVDQHCHTIVGCNLRQKQLQQGQHPQAMGTDLAQGDGWAYLSPMTSRLHRG